MIGFHRVRAVEDGLFEKAWALYTASFPRHEQRTLGMQVKLLEEPRYHFDVIEQDGAFAGILLYWQLSGYAYIEHFAIDQSLRGNALGSRSLAGFCQRQALVILEIDPPVDEISTRREGFYRRQGFVASSHAHLHPAYRADFPPHELVIMSHPRALTAGEVAVFQQELEDIVMVDAGMS